MALSAINIAVVRWNNGTQQSSVHPFYAGYNETNKINHVARIGFVLEKPAKSLTFSWTAARGSGDALINYKFLQSIDDSYNNAGTADNIKIADGSFTADKNDYRDYERTITHSLPSGQIYMYLWTANAPATSNYAGWYNNKQYYPLTITYEELEGSVNIGDRKALLKIAKGGEFRQIIPKVYINGEWRILGG